MKSEAAKWWEAYLAYRDSLDMDPVVGSYREHIARVVNKPWPAVTTADCERLRDSLDERARAGEIDSKTGFNAWSVFTTAAKAAAGLWKKDKSRRLRVREDNPCVGVVGPDLDDPKQLQWLYPDEFLTLVSCEDVPLEARCNYALAIYLFSRAGELKALRCADIDLQQGIVTIRLAYSRRKRGVKPTKSGNRGIRRFALEPNILPLVRAMHEQAGGEGNLVTMRQQKHWAADTREHLALAGLTREALFETDKTRKRLRYHDLRSTGLTWMAIRGDDPLKIQQRAGHRNFQTTLKYIRTAEAVGEVIGATFPPLPECLVAGRYRQSNRPSDLQPIETIVEAPGIEPGAALRR